MNKAKTNHGGCLKLFFFHILDCDNILLLLRMQFNQKPYNTQSLVKGLFLKLMGDVHIYNLKYIPPSSSLEESVCPLGLGPLDLRPFLRFSAFLSANTIFSLPDTFSAGKILRVISTNFEQLSNSSFDPKPQFITLPK